MNKPTRSTILGIRRSALVETALYLAVAVVLDRFVFQGDRFWNVSPHPFWPLVLLLAVQYGTGEGLIAALAGSAVLLIGNQPVQGLDQDSYDYLLTLIKHPLMWTVTALVVGEIRMRHVRERDTLEAELTQIQDSQRSLTAAHERLRIAKMNLQTRIAGQLRTAMTTYEAARALEKLHPIKVLLGVMDTVRTFMGPKKFSLYLLREDALEISIGEGWQPNDVHARVFRSDSRLFQEIVGRQRVLCAASLEDEVHLAREGLLAGPLIDRETGEVIGMLKIEMLDFADLHFSNVQAFGALCEWIATSYVNARKFQRMEQALTSALQGRIDEAA